MTNDAAAREHRGLALISELTRSLVDGAPTVETLSLICRTAKRLADFRFCGVLVPDASWTKFHLAGSYGLPPEFIESVNELFLVSVGQQQRESPTRQAAEQRRTIVSGDVHDVPEFTPWRSLALRYGYRSMISTPLMIDGEVIGVLNGYAGERREFTSAEIESLETLAAQAAVSLRVSILMEERQNTIERLRESNETLERQRVTLERAHEIHQRLTDAALKGADATAVAQTLSELVGRPVVVTYADGAVRTTSALDRFPEEHAELVAAVESDPARGTELTAAEIRIPGERLGRVVMSRRAASFDLDKRAVEHAATVLALETVKERMVETTQERLRSDFLTELLRGRLDDDSATIDRAHRHGITMSEGHRVVILRVDAADGLPSTHLRGELQRTLGAVVLGTGSTITALVPAAGKAPSAASIREALEGIRGRALNGGALSAGIGTVAIRFPDYARSHRDAEACLDLGRKIGKPNLIAAREELGILGLFIDTNRPDELLANAQATLGAAIEYDRVKTGQLLQTITTYLTEGCDVSATARHLFVHANTVKYRLRQVEELCGLSLRDADDLLNVRIATLTLALVSAR